MKYLLALVLALGIGWFLGPPVGEDVMSRILERGRVTDGWTVRTDIGDYEGHWLFRSVIARAGLGALVPQEALYYRNGVDANGEPLDGAHVYYLRFGPPSANIHGSLPPANAFWSITPYDVETLRLTENPINRFQLGDRTEGISFDGSGGLTIVLSHEEPSFGAENWLPTPAGAFDLVLRAYEPDNSMLSGRWQPPALCRADQPCAGASIQSLSGRRLSAEEWQEGDETATDVMDTASEDPVIEPGEGSSK